MRHAIVLGLLLAGCNFSLGSSSSGEQHQVTFSYGGCFFGCAVDQPMMLGTSERIDVKGSSIPAVGVRSSTPSILAVGDTSRTCCAPSGTCRTLATSDACTADETPSLSVTVNALGEGSASLDLVGADDATFDAVTLTVARPAALAVTCNTKPPPIQLASGSSCAVAWTATGADGKPLMASAGVTLKSSDAKVFELQAFAGPLETEVASQQGFLAQTTLVPTGPGDATLTATAGAVSTTATVHVGP